jgi:hypothetical protein
MMTFPPRILFLLLLPLALSLPAPMHAGNTGKPTIQPFDAIRQATISEVTPSSITITYQALQTTKKPPKRAPTVSRHGDKAPQIPHKTVTKTYVINELTDVEVNGVKATINDLHPGMSVSISADPPLSLDPVSPTNGGQADMILAQNAPPASPSPSPRKKK